MGEAGSERSAFISRIGTFFLLLGILLVILFIASDVSRVDQGRIANATQTYIAQGVLALQTRDAGAILAKQRGQPTPTLALPASGNSGPLSYLYFFCLGTLILGLGMFMKRKFSPPPAPGKRFEGIRKMQQKRREAAAKKEAEKKAKSAAKK
jgi:hypothetical protein